MQRVPGVEFPCSNTDMKLAEVLPLVLLACSSLLAGQNPPQNSTPAKPAEDYSGMYSFLRDGEFVQITVEDEGRVTGFVSRYGDSENDHGGFLDQFFKQGKLDGTRLSFTTDTVHGVWYEFKGTVERGEGKTPADEAYHVVKGTLTEYRTDANKTVSSKSHEVTFKSFPQDTDAAISTAQHRRAAPARAASTVAAPCLKSPRRVGVEMSLTLATRRPAFS
jgi:hypothetical protein